MTKLSHDGPRETLHSGCAPGRGQRSRDTDSFLISRKLLLLVGKWLECSTQQSPRCSASRVCSHSWSNVTWYQHIWNFTRIASSPRHGCILTKLGFSLTSPSLCLFGFLLYPNSQMAVSLCCEFCHSSHGETVCQTDSYTVRSDVLSLCALTL